jgi:hypothetical protein
MSLDIADPVSVSAGADETSAFVASRDAVWRVDLRRRTAARVGLPSGVVLDDIERIRSIENALIVIRRSAGGRQILRLELNARGNVVTRASSLQAPATAADDAYVTLSGDELVTLAPSEAAGSAGDAGGGTSLIVSRVPMRHKE